MPSYYDEKTKSWYCKFNYLDWQGQRQQKMKRGFPRKKDAADFETRFKASQKYDSKTTIGSIADSYLEEIAPRRRASTIKNYKTTFEKHIKPYFADLPIGALAEKHIIGWQNTILAVDLSDTYIHKLDTIFRTLYAFGAKRCKLLENPFDGLEKIGHARADTMQFWTLNQYRSFIALIEDPVKHLAFDLLFYTGIRAGELLALQIGDIDLVQGILHITKSYQRIGGKNIISPPKTKKGIRDITMPKFLCYEIIEYKKHIYGCDPEFPLFAKMCRGTLKYNLDKYSELAGIPRIRVHDLRHSHVSLLIEQGVAPMIIQERLGHESINTTLGTYGHLYPNKQKQVVDILDNL